MCILPSNSTSRSKLKANMVLLLPSGPSLVNASKSLAENWDKLSAMEKARTIFTLVVQGGRQLNLLPPPTAHATITSSPAVLVRQPCPNLSIPNPLVLCDECGTHPLALVLNTRT